MTSVDPSPDGDAPPPPEVTFLRDLFTTMKRATPCDVPKFDGNDFHRWRKQMTFHFKATELWDVLCLPLPEIPLRTASWTRSNDKALATIYNHLADEQQELIDECVFAKDAWDLLGRVYDKPSIVTVFKLLNDLNDLTKRQDENISHYVARAKRISRSLKDVGEPCSDHHVFNRILAGLPRSYESVRTTLTICRDLDFEVLMSTLLGMEARLASSTDRRRSASPVSRGISTRERPPLDSRDHPALGSRRDRSWGVARPPALDRSSVVPARGFF